MDILNWLLLHKDALYLMISLMKRSSLCDLEVARYEPNKDPVDKNIDFYLIYELTVHSRIP